MGGRIGLGQRMDLGSYPLRCNCRFLESQLHVWKAFWNQCNRIFYNLLRRQHSSGSDVGCASD